MSLTSKVRRAPRGFTLIELLTVIAIIGILAAILIPTVSKVRQSAKNTQCASVMREWGRIVMLYANDNKGYYTTKDWASAKKGEGPYRDYFTQSNELSLRMRTCPLHPDYGISDPPLTYSLVRGHQGDASLGGATAYPIDRIPLSKATTPSQYLLVVDTVGNSNVELSVVPNAAPINSLVMPMLTPSLTTNPTGTNIKETVEGAKRHGSQKVNAVFGDGSVKRITGNQAFPGDPTSILAQKNVWFRVN